ncbi:MAG: CobW family GTP-binding protein [Ilumatobacter sp.]|uniref:CobW family GTP-binding protein n=1 Tax=Ilumatobacter sp. TaxID=1967498 RepID=UPI00391B749A
MHVGAVRPSAIPVTVIGGYLGAGKTTLLNSLLRRADGRRIGVIVNDFGELGVDAALLADSMANDDGLVNLANGCVCCTLGDDLGTALRELALVAPRLDHIVIEASGVSDPAAIARWGSVPGFERGGTIVLAAADSVRRSASDRYVGGEVRRQLEGADLVVLTKIDRCDPGELAPVRTWLRSITAAPIVESVAGDLPIDVVLPDSPWIAGVDRLRSDDSSGAASVHQRYRRWRWGPDGSVERIGRQDIDAFMAGVPDGVLRLKGWVVVDAERHVLIQCVGPQREVVSLRGTPPQVGLVAIGLDDTADTFRRLDALAELHLGSVEPAGGMPGRRVD